MFTKAIIQRLWDLGEDKAKKKRTLGKRILDPPSQQRSLHAHAIFLVLNFLAERLIAFFEHSLYFKGL